MSVPESAAGGASLATNHSVRFQALFAVALPLLIPMLSQNLRFLADTVMIGRLGSSALAAQGLIAAFALMMLTPFGAVGGAVQAMVSRSRGRQDHEGELRPLRAAIALVVGLGIVYSVALALVAPFLVRLIILAPALRADAVAYLLPIVCSAIFTGLNSAFYGYWAAVKRTQLNLLVEVAIQVSNVIFGYVLIFGISPFPRLGLLGAGIAVTFSSMIGSILNIAIASKPSLFDPRLWLPSLKAEGAMVKVAWHSARLGVQSTLAFAALYFIVQFLGSVSLAGFVVLVRLATILIYPAQALGTAAASFVGEAVGRGDRDGAVQWGNLAIRTGCLVTALLGIPFWIWPGQALTLLVGSSNVAAVSTLPLRLLGVTIIFSGVGFLLTRLLANLGGANRVRKVSFLTQWVFLVPSVIVVGPLLGYGLLGVWLVQSASRILLAALLLHAWLAWGRAEFRLGSD